MVEVTPSLDMALHFLSTVPATVATADKAAAGGRRILFSFYVILISDFGNQRG